MLTHLSLSNFVLAKNIDINIEAGMTAITGETGAGKSVLLNGLSVVLGDRADSGLVMQGSPRAEVCATFDISKQKPAKRWLEEQSLDNEDKQCILRRVISKDGRSKAFINGQSVPLAQLKELGSQLIDVHSQHQHQSLLKPENHRRLLDEFSGCEALTEQVKQSYQHWRQQLKKLQHAQNSQDSSDAQVQLLTYQIEEFTQLDIQQGELETLELEQKQLSNGQNTLTTASQVTQLLEAEEFSPIEALQKATALLSPLCELYPELNSDYDLLNDALIQQQEALANLQSFCQGFDLDQNRLLEVESRLSKFYQLARKHHTNAEQLLEFQQDLENQLSHLTGSDVDVEQLEQICNELEAGHMDLCEQLTEIRMQKSAQFDELIMSQMRLLNMAQAEFKTQLTPLKESRFSAYGMEEVEFTVAMNPGTALKPLGKVASGGELSRISLAIQVICAQNSTIPTLVFDEVDVGISGGTAEMVGKLLRMLGHKGQILCVTHLPQVATLAHYHWQVSKKVIDNQTTTNIVNIESQSRIEEVARMLGGVDITQQTLAHANEMLLNSQTH